MAGSRGARCERVAEDDREAVLIGTDYLLQLRVRLRPSSIRGQGLRKGV